MDAVFVPAPVTASKEAVALRALHEHRARAVLLSVPERVRIPGTRENLHFRICGPELGVYCQVAAEDGARSNLRLLARLGTREGWRHVLVVTDRTALLETRRAVQRCPSFDVSVMAVEDAPPGGWIAAFVTETVRLATDRSRSCT